MSSSRHSFKLLLNLGYLVNYYTNYSFIKDNFKGLNYKLNMI